MVVETKFHATCINSQVADGVALLALADDELNPSQYILLQRTLEPDQQDRNLGHDKVHIELNSQVQSTYCDVEQAQVQRGRIVLQIDAKTASRLSSHKTIDITFDVTAAQLDEMRQQLRLLLGDEKVQDSVK